MAHRNDLIKTIQHFEAISCIGPSTLRGQGRGVIKAVRQCLARMNLARMPRRGRRRFDLWLNHRTKTILDHWPTRERPWGSARKALNLFLRSALYNHYLRNTYGLETVERWLEVPLDRVVAGALKREAGRGMLPRWRGLKHLTPADSDTFQAFADELAEREELPARVFLDNYLWLANR